MAIKDYNNRGNHLALMPVMGTQLVYRVGSTEDDKLSTLLEGCAKGERHCQKLLYQHFYGYAMSVCLRYSKSREDALEILNDGFMKIFSKADKYSPDRSLKGWIRRIMVNTALDLYRRELRHSQNLEITDSAPELAVEENVLRDLAYDDIVRLIQALSPVYRTVFNLFVIDGYTHEEIAGLLGISVGTSKSNLSKARANLRDMVRKYYKDEYQKYSG